MKKAGLFAALASVALLISVFNIGNHFFWKKGYEADFAPENHSHQLSDISEDGLFDQDFYLLDKTSGALLAVRESVRPVLALYADKETGLLVKWAAASGLIVSDSFAVAAADALKVSGDYELFAVMLLPTPEIGDHQSDTEMLEPVFEDQVLGLTILRRETPPLIQAKPLVLGKGGEVFAGTALLVLKPHVISSSELGVVSFWGFDRAYVEARYFTGPVLLVEDGEIGAPLFALRDGVPEFVGIIVGPFDEKSLGAVDTSILEELFALLR
ncbi:MAG: hypothetical protein UY15_C0002G0013 [Parcubacteria group bacterium GW2011_GWA2_47_9]|nr:MAG: hypothetical protein UY15_C0002G0013 [Parcubacteria group bacterium GW2011_GWA2_47_9]